MELSDRFYYFDTNKQIMKNKKIVDLLLKLWTYLSIGSAVVLAALKITEILPGLSWGWVLSPIWISLSAAMALVSLVMSKTHEK